MMINFLKVIKKYTIDRINIKKKTGKKDLKKRRQSQQKDRPQISPWHRKVCKFENM